MTNKERQIYCDYGIDVYGNKLVAPNGIAVAPLLKNGNSKVGKGVYTFSTLPTTKTYHTSYGDVKGTCKCDCDGCYATKGCYNFKSTIDCLALNTILIRKYPDWVERAINAQLEIVGACDVRISASGDMESADIVAMWKRIALNNKACRFWTYTKYAEFENTFDDIPNANIVKSIIPNIGYNFGHCDYIINAYKALKENGKKVHICKCGIDANQHCNNCDGCRINEFVLFVEHSTAYKAEQDAAYNTLADIVNNQ